MQLNYMRHNLRAEKNHSLFPMNGHEQMYRSPQKKGHNAKHSAHPPHHAQTPEQ